MKIGIITHYYNSKNYGGLLQAYALCRFLNEEGHEAKQICYDRYYELPFWNKYNFLTAHKYLIRRFISKHYKRIVNCRKNQNAKLIKDFATLKIPHTAKVYNSKNLHKAATEFDTFISGSDQVWHPNTVCGAYLLDFVPAEKKKISYAASISVDSLSNVQADRYAQSLKDFSAVSMREHKGAELISPLSPVEVQVVLDPTLLLTREQWDEICPTSSISGDYVFCYFLGDDAKQKECVREFAKKRGIKVVVLPMSGDAKNFGDENVTGASPAEFISLIKHASYVFTDSFHATVFSLLYEREVYVFERSGYKSMGQRIYTLTELFGVESHFCDTVEKLDNRYIESLPSIESLIKYGDFEKAKSESIRFLKNSL